jgi:hypothetical protein
MLLWLIRIQQEDFRSYNWIRNDTLSGIPVKPADVILTTVSNPALTLNPDGTITIAAGTPAGPQTLEYQICEIGSNPANCSTASVTVNVFKQQ